VYDVLPDFFKTDKCSGGILSDTRRCSKKNLTSKKKKHQITVFTTENVSIKFVRGIAHGRHWRPSS